MWIFLNYQDITVHMKLLLLKSHCIQFDNIKYIKHYMSSHINYIFLSLLNHNDSFLSYHLMITLVIGKTFILLSWRCRGTLTHRLNLTLCEFGIKVRNIDFRFNYRHKRWFYFFLFYFLPIYCFKPTMLFYFLCSFFCS